MVTAPDYAERVAKQLISKHARGVEKLIGDGERPPAAFFATTLKMLQPRSHTTRSRLEEAMRQCACLRAPRKQRSAWACLGCTQRAATLGPRSLQ